ncbi:ferritin-like domain-containing protein [Archangium gephyra]|nr:ferritin-like domain-containing protein [Archangium gephyra]
MRRQRWLSLAAAVGIGSVGQVASASPENCLRDDREARERELVELGVFLSDEDYRTFCASVDGFSKVAKAHKLSAEQAHRLLRFHWKYDSTTREIEQGPAALGALASRLHEHQKALTRCKVPNGGPEATPDFAVLRRPQRPHELLAFFRRVEDPRGFDDVVRVSVEKGTYAVKQERTRLHTHTSYVLRPEELPLRVLSTFSEEAIQTLTSAFGSCGPAELAKALAQAFSQPAVGPPHYKGLVSVWGGRLDLSAVASGQIAVMEGAMPGAPFTVFKRRANGTFAQVRAVSFGDMAGVMALEEELKARLRGRTVSKEELLLAVRASVMKLFGLTTLGTRAEAEAAFPLEVVQTTNGCFGRPDSQHTIALPSAPVLRGAWTPPTFEKGVFSVCVVGLPRKGPAPLDFTSLSLRRYTFSRWSFDTSTSQVSAGRLIEGDYVVPARLVLGCGRLYLPDGSPSSRVEPASLPSPSRPLTKKTGPAARRAAGEHWTYAARAEYVSVASFARATQEMMGVGAPRRFLLAMQKAAREEVRHAKAALRIAAQLLDVDVKELGPACYAPVVPLPPRASTHAELCKLTLLEAAIPETLGVAAARRTLKAVRTPLIREALRSILADECRHALLAWDMAQWARKEGKVTDTEWDRWVFEALQLSLQNLSMSTRHDLRKFGVPVREDYLAGVEGLSAGVDSAALAKMLSA